MLPRCDPAPVECPSNPSQTGFHISFQSPRPGEEEGREYHFVTPAEMAELKAEGAMVETAEFAGNHYGTSKRAVEEVMNGGEKEFGGTKDFSFQSRHKAEKTFSPKARKQSLNMFCWLKAEGRHMSLIGSAAGMN